MKISQHSMNACVFVGKKWVAFRGSRLTDARDQCIGLVAEQSTVQTQVGLLQSTLQPLALQKRKAR
jgi:hypothetical protein